MVFTRMTNEEFFMNNELERAQVYQILALNDEMLRSGCITRDEHDFVRHLQTDKLTRLHGRDSTHPRGTALN